MSRYSLQKGYLSLVAIVIVLIIGFMGVAASYLFSASSRASTDHLVSTQAFYLAESALEHVTHKLLAPTIANRSVCSFLNISNTLGAGAYTATTGISSAYPPLPTTLNGALTSSATTVPVASIAGYVSTGGRIIVDREAMNYSSASGSNFVGVTRGVDGTTAVAHASGAPVGQDQCNVSAQGGVPSLTVPANPSDVFGKRLLTEGIQLEEAWAVGNTASNNFSLIRWNRLTPLQWNNASAAGTNNISAVSMLSYADGWAVGASARALHWNGSSWVSQTLSPNVTYNDVYCLASNNCWAVGNRSGGTPVIQNWNGAAWSRATITNGANGDLNAVHCASSADCWAVGNNGGNRFYYWNGSNWAGISQTASSFSYNGVFCNSPNDCWAVGSNATFARKSAASTTWGTLATGLPAVQYNSVFCNSSTDCWVVGNATGSADVIGHWNGTAWSLDTSNPTPRANLLSVTCVNVKDCWAVGVEVSATNSSFNHWNGVSWTNFATGGLPAVSINSVSIVGSKGKPWSVWKETFP